MAGRVTWQQADAEHLLLPLGKTAGENLQPSSAAVPRHQRPADQILMLMRRLTRKSVEVEIFHHPNLLTVSTTHKKQANSVH